VTHEPQDNLGVGHEQWFREPSRREHWIAGALFVGFGIFFLLLFAVQRGWWFAWVVMGLGIISILHGLRHMLDAMRKGKTNP
jgi:fatty acid desaturase